MEGQQVQIGIYGKTALLILCIFAGAIPLACRWIPNGALRFSALLVVAVAYLIFALLSQKKSVLKPYRDLLISFFIFAFVQILNDLVPYFGAYVLHQGPILGNPLASTIFGTLAIQLLETVIAVGGVLALTKAWGQDLGSVYARKGKFGVLFVLSLLLFVLVTFVMARHTSRFIPVNGIFTISKFLHLLPALVVLVVSNGFQEEFLFRGLFLQKYEAFFGAKIAIILQAIVFSIAHLGISYSSSAVLFTILFVFPLGLIAGYLMRATKGVTTPAIFHAALDIPIYLAFLSYVS